jgi:hypothetical protein
VSITDTTLDDSSGAVDSQVTDANVDKIDGAGWIPIVFSWLPGGSPISNLPRDPTNTISDGANVANTDLVYRYACNSSDLTFELGAVLESQSYTSDDNKMAKDGGNNNNYYEVGTKLDILTGTTNPY